MLMHDYALLNTHSYSDLAAAVIFVAFKIIEQLDATFPLDEKVFIFIIFLN